MKCKCIYYVTKASLVLACHTHTIELNVSHLYVFDQSRCSVVTFTGCTAIWEALPPTGAFRNCSELNTELSKTMISYRLKYNIYRYFSSTGIPRIPIIGHVWIFQPYNNPNTNHKNNTKWVTEHKTKLLLWPFQSSDLNPLENE